MPARPADSEDIQNSRARFLDAAGAEFVDKGYDRCTIRAIAARAGTSIASLSRNWDGKRFLFQDVFDHHVGVINRAQHAAFDKLQLQDGTTLTDMITAFYEPVLGMRNEHSGTVSSHRIYCQALSDPSSEAKEIIRPLVADVRTRLIGIVRSYLPQLDEASIFLAMNVIHGTYIYPQLHGERLAGIMNIDPTSIDWRDAARTLAQMVTGGITAMQAPR